VNAGPGTFEELYAGTWRDLPRRSGIYVVEVPVGFSPEFIYPGGAGWLKGKDPNVAKWGDRYPQTADRARCQQIRDG
jgi:hypothetical protein